METNQQTREYLQVQRDCHQAYKIFKAKKDAAEPIAETHEHCRICQVAEAAVDGLCVGCLETQLMRRITPVGKRADIGVYWRERHASR